MCVEMGKANLANILLPPVNHKIEKKICQKVNMFIIVAMAYN